MIDQDKIDSLKASQPLDFADALYLLKHKFKVVRAGWINVGYIKIKKPSLANDGSSREACFQIFYTTGDEEQIVLQTKDILAEDWAIID